MPTPTEQVLEWYTKQFQSTGQVPSRLNSYKYGEQLGFRRNETDRILLSHPERTRNIPGRNYGRHQLRLFSSAQCDLGFINLNKKNYGIFFIGVNDLSRKVFVQRIPNKTWSSIKDAIINMMKTDGFQQLTKIVTDGEAALSLKNARELQETHPQLKIIRIQPNKAWRAERHIRYFKSTLAGIARSKNQSLFRWNGFVAHALDIMNNKRQILPNLSPNQINQTNALDVEMLVNQYVMYPLILKEEKLFKYHVGDSVVTKQRTRLFQNKISLTGYDTLEEVQKIIHRTTKPSGRYGEKDLPFYQLENQSTWYAESQLALRECPHPEAVKVIKN